MKFVCGSSHPTLAQHVSQESRIPLMKTTLQRFPDQEIFTKIHDSICGETVFVLQSISHPANDNLMELLIMIDALKRSAAQRIVAIIPYFGYARQDRLSGPGTPITARLVADLLETAGIHHLITIDLHAKQIEGFFNIPVHNLSLATLFEEEIRQRFQSPLIVSPDIGGVVRARELAHNLHTDLVIVEKRRHGPGQSEALNLIGQVQGKDCIILDDIVDSGQTIFKAAQVLLDAGARSVHACVTHGVLSHPALETLSASPLESLMLSDTIDIRTKTAPYPKVRLLSVTPLLASLMHNLAK